MKNVLDKHCGKKNQNTRYFAYIFSRKSCRFGDDLEEYGRDKQAINEQYNTAHTLCMLDN
jgi:hypothetical protein